MLRNSHKTVHDALEDLIVETVHISILIPANWVVIA